MPQSDRESPDCQYSEAGGLIFHSYGTNDAIVSAVGMILSFILLLCKLGLPG